VKPLPSFQFLPLRQPAGVHKAVNLPIAESTLNARPEAVTAVHRTGRSGRIYMAGSSRAEFLDSVRTALQLPVASYVAFRTGAALSVINQPRMPRLEGPFSSVGARVVEVSDGSRAKIFYPAAPGDCFKDAPYCTDGRKTSDGMAGLVGFRQLGQSFLLAHLATAKSGCLQDAPPINGEKMPLLVYSHGFGGNMDMATYLMRQIASFGIVVAALEHRDGTASNTVLADGSELPFSPNLLSASEQLRRRASELLAAAASGALGKDLPIDETRVFLGGHSYGGPAALLAAEQAASSSKSMKIAGLLLHDPALGMGSMDLARRAASGALGYPVLSFTSDEYDRAGVRCGTTYHVDGCFHGNFVDAALWAPLWVMRPLSTVIPAAGPRDPEEIHAVLASTAAEYMQDGGRDMQLLGQRNEILQLRLKG